MHLAADGAVFEFVAHKTVSLALQERFPIGILHPTKFEFLARIETTLNCIGTVLDCIGTI